MSIFVTNELCFWTLSIVG